MFADGAESTGIKKKKHRRTTSETLAIELALNMSDFQTQEPNEITIPEHAVVTQNPSKFVSPFEASPQSPRSSFKNNNTRGTERPRLQWGATNTLTSIAALLEGEANGTSKAVKNGDSHKLNRSIPQSASTITSPDFGIQQGSKRSSEEATTDDTDRRLSRRGKYVCGKCGQPKEGHICKVKVARSVEVQVDLAITGTPRINAKGRRSKGSFTAALSELPDGETYL